MTHQIIPEQKYNRLKVICELPTKNKKRQVLCRCDCGVERAFDWSKVRTGQTKSCGCYGREMLKPNDIKDLTGQVFGRLTALRPDEGKDSGGSIIWTCRCKCGREVHVPSRDLISGNTKSCGCLLSDHTVSLQANNEQYTIDGVFVPILTKKVATNNVTGVKGVSVQHLKIGRVRYIATITIKGKRHYLGVFDRLEDAVDARRKAEEIYHKPYIDTLETKSPPTSEG
ncbi:hypothetical protein [Paenibacillus sonchi]|uniref:hypothetical protein n=1 Tax=Paenibacillus sonchi TaxID=373687 RepID=UPI001E4332D0|nr:hypothetical protein [Paenibacillus sonchi]MCE3203400.1 hypothetical protein [Paenibacillus sonchi]